MAKHIHLLDLESPISFFKELASGGMQAHRLLVLVNSRVALVSVSKGRSSSHTLNFLLKSLGIWCVPSDIALQQMHFRDTSQSRVGALRCPCSLLLSLHWLRRTRSQIWSC